MTEKQKTQITRLRGEGYGYGKISQMLGISLNTVKSFCRRNNLKKKASEAPAVKSAEERTFCQNCGREIKQVPKRKKKRFCCDECRMQWWNSHLDQVKRKAFYHYRCIYCGKEYQVYGDQRRKYCSHECYIAARFKGEGHHD